MLVREAQGERFPESKVVLVRDWDVLGTIVDVFREVVGFLDALANPIDAPRSLRDVCGVLKRHICADPLERLKQLGAIDGGKRTRGIHDA
jgi:hypothetical protein